MEFHPKSPGKEASYANYVPAVRTRWTATSRERNPDPRAVQEPCASFLNSEAINSDVGD